MKILWASCICRKENFGVLLKRNTKSLIFSQLAITPWSSVCSAENQILAHQHLTVLEESCQWTGSGFFLHLRGNGAGSDGKGGVSSKGGWSNLMIDVKKHTHVSIAFFLLHFLYFEPQVNFEGHAANGL